MVGCRENPLRLGLCFLERLSPLRSLGPTLKGITLKGGPREAYFATSALRGSLVSLPLPACVSQSVTRATGEGKRLLAACSRSAGGGGERHHCHRRPEDDESEGGAAAERAPA